MLLVLFSCSDDVNRIMLKREMMITSFLIFLLSAITIRLSSSCFRDKYICPAHHETLRYQRSKREMPPEDLIISYLSLSLSLLPFLSSPPAIFFIDLHLPHFILVDPQKHPVVTPPALLIFSHTVWYNHRMGKCIHCWEKSIFD